jgi:hypothetical protein
MVTEDGYQSLNKSRKMQNKWLLRRAWRICGGAWGTRSPVKTLCTTGCPVPSISAAGRPAITGGNPNGVHDANGFFFNACRFRRSSDGSIAVAFAGAGADTAI